MAAPLFYTPKVQFLDSNGDPLSGGKVYFYEIDTTTPKDTYSDFAKSTANANPVILNARGEAAIFLDGHYDGKVTDSSDNLVYSFEDVTSELDIASINYTHSGSGASERTLQSRLEDHISVKDFGAVGDGSTDDTSAIQAAINYVSGISSAAMPAVFFPAGIYKITAKLSSSEDFIRLVGAGRGRATGSTTVIDGGSAILYAGSALASTEGVITFGSAGDQGRGCSIQDISILCQGNGNGIYGERMNLGRISRVYIDSPVIGIVLKDSAYSNVIDNCEIYDPVTGGIDLNEDCHSVTVRDVSFNSDSATSNTPSYALRIAQTANCSSVYVTGCNFDYYKVTRHVYLVNDCKGFSFIGNYIEVKGDGVSGTPIALGGGSGITIVGNRLTSTDSPTATTVDYGVDCQSPCEDVFIAGNYFSGFDTACVRVASGANNVVTAGNSTNGLTEVNDQNTGISGEVVQIGSGVVTTNSLYTNLAALNNSSELTISSGVITVTGSKHTVDTEADAASDDLDTIHGGSVDGQLLLLSAEDGARTVVVKDGTGNINLPADFSLDSNRDRILLEWDSSASTWVQIASSNNA